jgi:hypothetical protein
MEFDAGDERFHEVERAVTCVECGASSGVGWLGWGAYRVDDPELSEPPTLAFYCHACATREFGARARLRHPDAG